MLNITAIVRRSLGRVDFDERTGEVCTAACRAAARREQDRERVLSLRGPR